MRQSWPKSRHHHSIQLQRNRKIIKIKTSVRKTGFWAQIKIWAILLWYANNYTITLGLQYLQSDLLNLGQIP